MENMDHEGENSLMQGSYNQRTGNQKWNSRYYK